MQGKKGKKYSRLKNLLKLIIRSLVGLLAFIMLTGVPLQTQETEKPIEEVIPEGVTPKETVKTPVYISEELPTEIKEKLSNWFSIKFHDMDVRYFLELISKKYNLNIVTTKSVSGKLTMLLENVSVYDALEIVMINNGLAKEIRGNIINIMTAAEYAGLYGEPYNEKRQLKVIKLNHTKPSNLIKVIENLKSTVGRVIMDDATNTIILMEVPEKIKQLETLIKGLDVLTETQVFELQYGDVEDIEALIAKELSQNIGTMKVDTRMSRLIITDTPEVLKKIAGFIRALDARPREVLIEAKMIQIVLRDIFSLGVNWEKVFSTQSKFKGLTLIGNFPIRPTPARSAKITLGELATDNYTATIEALREFGNTKLISSPRLVTLSGKEALFMVGKREAYATTTVTQTEAAATTAETIQFVDVGITLKVTPTINQERFIIMKIEPEISDVIRWETTAQGNRVPIIQTSNARTTVMVKDGVTIVIAGLIRDEIENISTGIPILSQIPLIGGLFRYTLDKKIKSETVIFLTPYIITGEADTSVLTKQADLLRKQPKDLRDIK